MNEVELAAHNTRITSAPYVCRRLTFLRERAGLSHDGYRGIDRTQVHALENGKALPRMPTIIRMLDELGLLMVDIFIDNADSKLLNDEAIDAKRIGAYFKNLRVSRGMSVMTAQVGIYGGKKGHSYDRLERGEKCPQLDTLAKVCTFHRVTVESVFEPILDEVAHAAE